MKKIENFIILICNAPNIENAKQIAHKLVKEKLAACVNLIDGITSIYEWEGVIEEEQEVTLLIKSHSDYADSIEKVILDLHSYDTPEIIQLKVESSNEKYYDWLLGVLNK